LTHAAGLSGIADQEAALNAIAANRTLLDDPDPVAPILKAVGKALRSALHNEVQAYCNTYSAELKKLEGNPVWAKLTKKKQAEILSGCGVCTCPEPETGTDSQLQAELTTCGLSHWRTLTDALPTRFGQAMEKAILESEPKAERVSLPGATIKNKEEMENWLGEAKGRIEKGLKKGPVII
jgi:hypothetical protein